jgi:hypothetical protein
VQRPELATRGGRLVSRRRLRQGLLAAQLDHGVQHRVDGSDPGQQGLGQLAGGELPAAQQPGDVGRRADQEFLQGRHAYSSAV